MRICSFVQGDKMKFIVMLLCAGLCASASAAKQAKNIIMVVGDGMGPSYTTAYRYFTDDKMTAQVENTVFDRLLVGMASTHPHQVSGYVTDSAAGATALATGVKTYNGAIGVDHSKQAVQSVLQWAKMQGMKTGVAVTSQINHATPAAFTTHNESRHNYNEIADSYYDQKIAGKFILDVMLGGGWDFFIREDRNLVEQFKQAGYQYIDSTEQLNGTDPSKPLLGLFAEVGLPEALDSKDKQRLPALTKTAIKHLENEQGFFLLVEASQVDWAGHGNDIAAAMAEMHDLALTLEWLESYIEQHPDTLLLVTADHSTGGMSIAADGDYSWSPQWLTQLKMSPLSIAKQISGAKNKGKLAGELLGFELKKEEVNRLQSMDSTDAKDVYIVLKTLLDKRSNTGWTTSGHTAIDVPVFARGPGAEMFRGFQDNTQIAERIFTLLGRR
ncbi:MAG: alkaline phosphatase [Paraglaciecola sp.]|jgi:alkaline phosphatase